MDVSRFDMSGIEIAWCPGCGDFGILSSLKKSLAELDIAPEKLVMVSGIGQAAKMPHYLKCNVFNGLHGRALPPATAIKAVNPGLTVIAASGDGDMYGEGGNHFMNTVRRNPDITNIVHNNMIYGLTKGQASPTSRPGLVTPIQPGGVVNEPFNPLAVAISLDASFVARAFIGDAEETKDIIKQAISHKGYALVDILQPCVSFNKSNTYKWFKDNTVYLDDSHDPENKIMALEKALEVDKLPLGVFYTKKSKATFEENITIYKNDSTPVSKRTRSKESIRKLIASQTA